MDDITQARYNFVLAFQYCSNGAEFPVFREISACEDERMHTGYCLPLGSGLNFRWQYTVKSEYDVDYPVLFTEGFDLSLIKVIAWKNNNIGKADVNTRAKATTTWAELKMH